MGGEQYSFSFSCLKKIILIIIIIILKICIKNIRSYNNNNISMLNIYKAINALAKICVYV